MTTKSHIMPALFTIALCAVVAANLDSAWGPHGPTIMTWQTALPLGDPPFPCPILTKTGEKCIFPE